MRIGFEGGPADGFVEELAGIETALPSLYRSRDEPQHVSSVYRRAGDGPDAATGVWRYSLAAY